ncbi:hypothetical protein ATO6_21690 [Oceanicola sp. 22II-s10i]|uniref:heme-dependent oxidative N-demethylase family protein n=1 Tax=Oceanicola sp. 22II-s10i TaxID=1317116 RepID=UPI000B522766|nr:DUF3445 domain-containing protein [Oceanicola sp. 22II-s10i]OWU82912.1 hypothetical protein ATO6_21690 [Oceanicola sp. 22II-s10i]
MTAIFQSRLPYSEADRRPGPGIAPLDPTEWLVQDDAFAGQMATRERLLAERRDDVLALRPEGEAAAVELLDEVLGFLATAPGYAVGDGEVQRPDGVTVAVDRADPMGTLGRLVQEDFCLLQKPEGAAEHVLTGAVLCFPSAWTLAQKIGHPLLRIHLPVKEYDADLGRRVQRLFDGIQPGRPLWRFNWLPTDDENLYRPKLEFADKIRRPGLPYLRSERQTLWRLPQSRAVVFGIHTYLVKWPQEA